MKNASLKTTTSDNNNKVHIYILAAKITYFYSLHTTYYQGPLPTHSMLS